MPNSFAYLVLALWPLVMFVFFKRMPVGRALIWSLLGAYLLLPPLPTSFDFPLLPPISKLTLPAVTCVFMVVFVARERIEVFPRSKFALWLMLAFVFGPTFTILTNDEPIIFAAGGLRGLLARDIIALIINQGILLIGFVLARQFLNTKEHLRELLLAFLIAGLAYAFPMLLEIRLSPQLNVWIYGYFQHSFEQMIRGGGFRAIVFLSHGIWAAMFIMLALAASVILWRTEATKGRQKYFIAAIFLAIVLVLNKTLGPVVYAVIFLATVFAVNWRMQSRIAVVLASLVLIYPVAKYANLVPQEQILALASKASEERSYSLQFRFENEDILLERAKEKPFFGWGTWGRNHIHDPITGRILTVSDGRWIITLGVFGWLGFLAEFGLLALPIFMFAYQAGVGQRKGEQRFRLQISGDIPVEKAPIDRLTRHTPSPIGGGLSLLLAINLVDLLPNATLTPLTWLISGALLGYSERIAHLVNEISLPRKKTILETPDRIELPSGPRTVL